MKSLQKVFDLKRHLGKVYLTGLQKSCAISFAVKCFFFLFIYFFNDISLDRVVLLENTNDFFSCLMLLFSAFCSVMSLLFISSWALNARENRAFFSSVRRCKIEREKNGPQTNHNIEQRFVFLKLWTCFSISLLRPSLVFGARLSDSVVSELLLFYRYIRNDVVIFILFR